MVSRTLILVNVVLAFLILATVFQFARDDDIHSARRHLKGRSGSSSSRSSRSSRASRSYRSSTSTRASTYSNPQGTTRTTRSYRAASTPPTRATYTSTRTYRTATTYTYTGTNFQSTTNTQTYATTPTTHTTSYRATQSADYYRTGMMIAAGGVGAGAGALWMGYQSYNYGAYYSYNYYYYDRDAYYSTGRQQYPTMPEPEPQLFTYIEGSCASHGCVAMNETDTCYNATQNIVGSTFQTSYISNYTGVLTAAPTFCTHLGSTSKTEMWPEATADACSSSWPCLCSCMIVLEDQDNSVKAMSLIFAALLSFFVFA